MRVGVVTNLRAGRKNTRLQRVLSFLKTQPDIPHVETEEHQHVGEALALLAREGVNILVVNGGDGTLQHVLTEILRGGVFPSPPLIVPLCGGRTNMNALVIGSYHDPVRSLFTVLTADRNGAIAERVVHQPVLRVELGSAPETYYGLCFGVGVLHRAIDFKHKILPEQRFQGLLGAAAFTGAMIFRAAFGSATGLLEPDSIAMSLDHQCAEARRYLLLLATSLDRLLFNVRPFWGKERAPIRLTAVTPEARRTPGVVMRVLRGRPPCADAASAGYLSRNVHQLDLQLDCGLILDGELFAPQAARTVKITADHRLQFVRSV